MIRNLAIAAAIVSTALFTGCSNNKKADANTAAVSVGNTKCCCGSKADGMHYVTYDGKKYGVCSQACVDQFNKMSDADKKAAAAKMSKM